MSSLTRKVELNPQKFRIPDGFKEMMEGYTKAVLKYQPDNIPAFSAEYFQAALDGHLDQFIQSHEHYLNTNMKTLQDYANVAPNGNEMGMNDTGNVGTSTHRGNSARVYRRSDSADELDEEELLAMQVCPHIPSVSSIRIVLVNLT